MRYVIYGAGAVGGVIGARLFEQGRDVVLVARGDHLAAIRRAGLSLRAPLASVTLPVPVVGNAAEISFRDSDEFVLLATKTQDLTPALDDLRAAAGSEIPERSSRGRRGDVIQIMAGR